MYWNNKKPYKDYTFYTPFSSFVFPILGFGDAVDNTECWDPIIKYVEDQYDNYLDAEMRVTRFPIADQRVHVCLYFIAPTGHALKPLDIEFMKRIHDKVC